MTACQPNLVEAINLCRDQGRHYSQKRTVVGDLQRLQCLTTDRVYRKASSHADAFKAMREEAKGGAYNIELFKRIEEIINATKGE